jgi:hypothetical protein
VITVTDTKTPYKAISLQNFVTSFGSLYQYCVGYYQLSEVYLAFVTFSELDLLPYSRDWHYKLYILNYLFCILRLVVKNTNEPRTFRVLG